jgi:23S rRNA (uracil1939-C5)-methyltransferase
MEAVSIATRTIVELGEMTLDGDVTARLPDGTTVLVELGIPGERVELRSMSSRDRRRAQIERIVTPAPSRVTPRCRHFGPCGGCAWQHIAYEEQLALKRRMCERLLADALGADAPPVDPTLAATGREGGPWGYRNKVHFVFTERAGTLALGHFRRRSSEVLPVDECPVHAPDGNAIAFRTVEELGRAGIPPASPDLARGTLRHLVVRVASTGERLLTTVVRRLDRRVPDTLVRAVPAARDETSLHVNLHPEDDPYLFGETTKKVRGRDRLREQLGGVSYLLSPTAFFQTNVAAAEVLVRLVTGAVPAGAATVLDLYAGAGLFALPLARRGLRVTAIEEHPGAVADGVAARRLNGIDGARCRFVAARVEDAIKRPLPSPPDVVILDPPRGGCERRVLQHVLARLRAPRVIYVSCNPAALAADLAIARDGGYRAERVQPVDMFPHTPHIEAVAVLTAVRLRAEG